jgi:hypothetical protein
MVATPEDIARKYGTRFVHLMSLDEHVKYLLCVYASQNKLKRKMGYVLTPHETIPGVYTTGESTEDYINRVLHNTAVTTKIKCMQDYEKWFNLCDDPRFELLTRSKFCTKSISFTNGVFNLDTLKFTPWGEVEKPPITDHYFDVNLDLENILHTPTPHWDKYLLHQLSPEVQYILEVSTGRLFYPVGSHDNWQCFGYVKGDTGTGKSVYINSIQDMFPKGSIHVISANQEKIFGLEAIAQARVILVPECPEDMKTIFDRTILQSIVSGDHINVPGKFKMSKSVVIQAPLVVAGNYWFNYKDAGGAVARRTLGFLFDTHVNQNKKDTTLLAKIRTELVPIMIRCIFKYREACQKHGSSDIWSWVPESLRIVRDEVKRETSVLANFLANGDSRCQIVYMDGYEEEWKDLQSVYNNHIEFSHKNTGEPMKIKDKQPILDAGYTLETRHMCKLCKQLQTKQNCGSHLHKNNKVDRVYIQNMQIIKIPGHAFGSASTKP